MTEIKIKVLGLSGYCYHEGVVSYQEYGDVQYHEIALFTYAQYPLDWDYYPGGQCPYPD